MQTEKIVVVISQDDAFYELVQPKLQHFKYLSITEKSYLQSLIKILKHKIKFVLFDLNCSMDKDIELVQVLNLIRPKLPVIVSTANLSNETRIELATLGVLYVVNRSSIDNEMTKILEIIERYYLKFNKK